MRRCWLAASLLVTAAACERATVALDVVLDGDAGLAPCADYADLRCVNFLDFTVQKQGGEVLSHCLRVSAPLADLCDVRSLADGAELFRLDPDDPVKITMTGLRVFPATGCQPYATCMRAVFTATTGPDLVRLGSVADGALALTITSVGECGAREEYYPRGEGETCEQVCGSENVVPECNLPGGCVCKVIAGRPDAGTTIAQPDAR